MLKVKSRSIHHRDAPWTSRGKSLASPSPQTAPTALGTLRAVESMLAKILSGRASMPMVEVLLPWSSAVLASVSGTSLGRPFQLISRLASRTRAPGAWQQLTFPIPIVISMVISGIRVSSPTLIYAEPGPVIRRCTARTVSTVLCPSERWGELIVRQAQGLARIMLQIITQLLLIRIGSLVPFSSIKPPRYLGM